MNKIIKAMIFSKIVLVTMKIYIEYKLFYINYEWGLFNESDRFDRIGPY
jgi:hypothetical protein